MKRVISTSIAVMTILMGCSFSKDGNPPKTPLATEFKTENSFQYLVLYSSYADLTAALKTKSEVEINTPFSDGRTPLETAVYRGNWEITDAIIAAGASPFIKNKITGKSLYDTYQTVTRKETDSLRIDIFRTTSRAISQIKTNIRAIITQDPEGYLHKVLALNIPITIIFDSLFRLYPKFPPHIVEKIISTQSLDSDLTTKQQEAASNLFIKELDSQLDSENPHFSLLNFFSAKTQSAIISYRFYTEDSTYHISPAALMLWRNGRAFPKHESLSAQIQQLSHWPENNAIAICSSNCRDLQSAERIVTYDEVLKDPALVDIMNEALSERSGQFWRLPVMEPR